MVVRVLANIEFEPEELINEVAREYECSIREVNMDYIREYIADHIDCIKLTNTNVIETPGSWGPAIDGIEERDFYEISDILEQMQNTI